MTVSIVAMRSTIQVMTMRARIAIFARLFGSTSACCAIANEAVGIRGGGVMS